MIKKLLSGKSKLSQNFYGILLCLLCIFACTLAWFYNFRQGNMDEAEMGSIEATDFEISLDGSTYKEEWKLSMPSSLEFEPVSGDGENMYIPKIAAESNDADSALWWEPCTYDESAEKNSYYSFKLYFRCDKAGYAVLSGLNVDPAAAPEYRQGSKYTDKDGREVTSKGEASVERPVETSTLYQLITGNPVITKDYMAGAARVMMMNEETASEGVLQKTIFIPNDTYHLNINQSGGQCSCSFNEKWTGTETYAYYNGSEKSDYSDFDTMTESKLGRTETYYVMEFSGEKESDGYYYGELTVCIWLEGYDNEAHDILSGGQIKFDMSFDFEEADN